MFIYHLVILLWPTQILAPHDEEGIATIGAAVVIGGNVLLFATIGLIAALTIRISPLYSALAAIVFAGLSLWALFGAGFTLAYVDWGAFICACLVYAIPFTLARRIVARG